MCLNNNNNNANVFYYLLFIIYYLFTIIRVCLYPSLSSRNDTLGSSSLLDEILLRPPKCELKGISSSIYHNNFNEMSSHKKDNDTILKIISLKNLVKQNDMAPTGSLRVGINIGNQIRARKSPIEGQEPIGLSVDCHSIGVVSTTDSFQFSQRDG